MTELLIVLGVVVASFALRTFPNRLLGKLGALGILVASFLAIYFPTGNIWAGIAGMSVWFLLPWVEILTRIRKLRLPLSQKLEKQAPPGNRRFPALNELTSEIEGAGFDYVSDNGWEWDGTSQFFRIFYKENQRVEAAICFTEQEHVSWVYVSLTSRHKDGRSFRTSNLPFNNPMKVPPEVILRREPEVASFEDLAGIHQTWMEGLGFSPENFKEENPEEFPQMIEEETGRQIKYNQEFGLISAGEVENTVRYSWRGLFFLYFQLIKDMVRMC